jgi:hypothetical protein
MMGFMVRYLDVVVGELARMRTALRECMEDKMQMATAV